MPKLHYFASCAYSALQDENKKSQLLQVIPSLHGVLWEDYYAQYWQHEQHKTTHHACPKVGLQAFDLFLQDGIITGESPRATQAGHPDFPTDIMHACPSSPLCSLYSPLRITQPYIRRTLHEAWEKALEGSANPIEAWASLHNTKTKNTDGKNTAYQKERGQGDFVRLSWEEANIIIAAAIIHSCIEQGPQSILGYSCGYTKPIGEVDAHEQNTPIMNAKQTIADKSMIDMAAYAAGSRFLHLLGAHLLDYPMDSIQAGLRILSNASDWNDTQTHHSNKEFYQTNTVNMLALDSQYSILFAWHTGGQHFFSENTKPINTEASSLALIIHAENSFHSTCLHADIILPAPHAYECDELHFAHKGSFLYASAALQNGIWESRTYWQQFADIAKKISLLSEAGLKSKKHRAKEYSQYVDLYSKYSALGPSITHINSIKAYGMVWDCASEYEILRSCLGVVHGNALTKGMPHIKSAKDACNCMLALSPESNGALNALLWNVEKKENTESTTSKPSHTPYMTFRMLSQQPHKILKCPYTVTQGEQTYPFIPSFPVESKRLAKPQELSLSSANLVQDMLLQKQSKALRKDERQILHDMAVLLHYPDPAPWNNIINGDSTLAIQNTALARCIQSIKKQSLVDMQALYVNTFELRQDCTLHMAWHRYGDTLQRHHAYAALHALYRDAGFEPQVFPSTLPDYLPKILEFSAHAPDWAVQIIRQAFGHEIQALHKNVSSIQCPYADILGLTVLTLSLD